jgi:hypothetical protein
MKKSIILTISMAQILTAHVVEIENAAEFKKYTSEKNKLVVKVENPYKEISNESCYKGITFAAVDIDTHQDLATQNNVSGLPTFVYFENGNKKNESVGVRSMHTFKEDFRKELNKTFNIAKGTDTEADATASAVEEQKSSDDSSTMAEDQKSHTIFSQFTDILRRIFHFIADLIMSMFTSVKNIFGIA